MKYRKLFTTLFAAFLPIALWAGQNSPPDQTQAISPDNQAQTTENNERTPDGTVAVFKVLVIGRTVKAINYWHRESTPIGFEGTSLLATAKGKATVENKNGSTRIHAEFKNLAPAAMHFGAPYLTYVMWAITPDGRPENLGEVMPNNDGNATIDAATNLQTFGLIVTAEPYFAVTRPSDMVVAQNVVLSGTTGTIEQVDAKFELLKRGAYTSRVASSDVVPIAIKGEAPLDVYEAENAIRIARWAGADDDAAGTLARAQQDLTNAQDLSGSRGDRKAIISAAREAVQTAEDARIIALSKQETLEQAQTKHNAEQAQVQAQEARAEATQAQDQAAQASAQAAADAQARAQAEAARKLAEHQANQAASVASDALARADAAEQQARAVRARLLNQLNTVLQTEDTSRGLVIRMSDVLFSSGHYQLTGDAKIALAKIAGVLMAYPGLKLEVDGFTDSTGSDEVNQTLSDKRAEAVRTFLVAQGVPSDSVKAQGLGDADPIASNSSAAGRQLNRRVDMIVSGSVIGTQLASGAMASDAGSR
jgi:outer membrane protein OmpA-like peptidoglycan-associated protein